MPGVCFLSQGAAVMMENQGDLLKMGLSALCNMLKQKAFMNRTVREIMWGYNDPLLNAINIIAPGLLPFKGKFGLFIDVSKVVVGNAKITAILILGIAQTQLSRS